MTPSTWEAVSDVLRAVEALYELVTERTADIVARCDQGGALELADALRGAGMLLVRSGDAIAEEVGN